jgi:hypothetical protein
VDTGGKIQFPQYTHGLRSLEPSLLACSHGANVQVAGCRSTAQMWRSSLGRPSLSSVEKPSSIKERAIGCMLKTDDKVFFRLPQEDTAKKRNLRAGIVLSLEDDVCVIQLEQPCPVDEATEGFLHFEVKQKFLQQSARVLRKDSEDPFVFAVALQGSPVSSEQRQCFRVSCLGENIKATVADETGCEVVDVSATGFAFYGRREYEIGRRVRVTLAYDGKEYTGHGTIQSIRRINPKTLRCGVHCTDSGDDTLARSLTSINVAIQVERRRRLARND